MDKFPHMKGKVLHKQDCKYVGKDVFIKYSQTSRLTLPLLNFILDKTCESNELTRATQFVRETINMIKD